MKRVVLVLRHTPLNHIKNLEAFRLGLGLTLSNNEVTVVMVDEGVLNAIDFRPEVIDRPSVAAFLDFYEDVGIRSMADQGAAERFGVTRIRKGVELVDHKLIVDAIRQADVVIPF
ncbi:MAG: DsrE family protein [Nitrospirae bacterium]|nr:DsrE family protein [Nitrospirota bacterium]